MVSLSDKTTLEVQIDLQNKQVVVTQRGEVGVEMGKITIPMDDIKKLGSKLKGALSLLPLDILKKS